VRPWFPSLKPLHLVLRVMLIELSRTHPGNHATTVCSQPFLSVLRWAEWRVPASRTAIGLRGAGNPRLDGLSVGLKGG
jgi:hypothetical protein